MTLPLEADSLPLATDAHGVIRVAGTRVTLDTVVSVFKAGATPEEIAQDFPSLELADIYAVVTYYLRHQPDVEAYLERGRQEAEAFRRKYEARFGKNDLRERLLARLQNRQS